MWYVVLKANHNIPKVIIQPQIVVYHIKDTIFWKQITTKRQFRYNRLSLFITSKIQFFESKSQHTWHWATTTLSCLSHQRYNFLKANHNVSENFTIFQVVVYHIKDTIFWKQITTQCLSPAHTPGCLSHQRYNFLKANHNINIAIVSRSVVVYHIKDTIFWKQITTGPGRSINLNLLFITSKIQFFESKSQPIFLNSSFNSSCLSHQRYNFLKANHNYIRTQPDGIQVVYHIKDTIFWKQITTRRTWCLLTHQLFITSKIQFFESKSQLYLRTSGTEDGCLSHQRYNFLKANHNPSGVAGGAAGVVYHIKDTIFWKQITTTYFPAEGKYQLFITSKIQFFESKSQQKRKVNLVQPVVYHIKDTIFWKQITTAAPR